MIKLRWPSLPFVAVYWQDHHSPASTHVMTPDEAVQMNKPIPMVTTGFLLADGPEGLVVAGEWCGDHDYRNVTMIGRPMIVEVFKLSKPRLNTKHHSPASSLPVPPSPAEPSPQDS